MPRFRWTKLQDFCLRLGLLKLLVATVKTSRFGVPREQVVKRFSTTLFTPASPIARAAALSVVGEPLDEKITLVDALVITSGLPSWGQPIRKETSYKVLDWSQTIGLIGKGYQLTERGQLLYSLFPADAVGQFLGGNYEAWNPFQLNIMEKGFFLYHLGENDELLWQLLAELAAREPESALTASETYRITLDAFRKVLRRAEPRLPIPELPRFRVARELADTIEWELSPDADSTSRLRTQNRFRSPGVPMTSRRKTHKNADHQAIPRFEQLVDLSFLTKPVAQHLRGRELERARKAWSFTITRAPQRFFSAVGGVDRLNEGSWYWSDFAQGFAAAELPSRYVKRPSRATMIDFFADAYQLIRRPVGQTPFESTAILTMLLGLERGVIIEIRDLHRELLALKTGGKLQDAIFFAGGNDIPAMFILLRGDFRAEYRKLIANERDQAALPRYRVHRDP